MIGSDSQVPLDALADEFASRIRRGEKVEVEQYAAAWPQLAEEIRQLFPAVQAMERLKRRKDHELHGRAAMPQRIGDFRVLREIGRGGMGIVYEAVQESLDRHVALKVLPRPSTWDERRLRRFRREARTAARLHHTNIVPVLGVGEEDGHHYIVMQYIRGVGLDEVVAALAQLTAGESAGHETNARAVSARAATLAFSLASSDDALHRPQSLDPAEHANGTPFQGVEPPDPAEHPNSTPFQGVEPPDPAEHANGTPFQGVEPLDPAEHPNGTPFQGVEPPDPAEHANGTPFQGVEPPDPAEHPNGTPFQGVEPSEHDFDAGAHGKSAGDAPRLGKPCEKPGEKHPGRRAPLWSNIARIGVQAAEALHYAHQQGTTHRDVKPGNLLLDEQGKVWVADFGLATVEHEGDHSSDVVGTLRYMAPEQLRGVADARSDIYSLGLSLYEMITLQPAFDDHQRRRSLIEGAVSPEPPRPARIRPGVPRDLETIVVKATAADPRRRYASARALSDDLLAFLERRPIRARRVSPLERLIQWSRRNKPLAAAAALVATLLIAVAVTASVASWQTHRSAAAARAALRREKAQRQRAEATLEISLEALDQVYRRFVPDRMRDAAALAVPGGADWEPPPPPITPADAAMLEDVLSVYDRFAEQQVDSERLVEESARANWRVAEIQLRLGDYERAEAACRRAIERYRQLAARRDGPRQIELARVHNQLGVVYLAQQRHQQAIQTHRAALDCLLPDGPPADWSKLGPQVRSEVARTDYLLSLAGEAGDRRDGLARAVRLLESLHRSDPDAGPYRHLLALCYLQLEDDPFSPRTEEAIDLLDQLVCDFPELPDYRFDLIAACARGDMRSAFHRNRLEQRLRRALLHSRQLAAANPNVRDYVQTHAHVLQRLGALLTDKSDSVADAERTAVIREAERLLRQAADEQTLLADRFPDEVAFRFYLANTQNILADLLLQARDYDAARDFCDRAIGQLYGLPATRSNHSVLATAYRTLSQVHRRQGRPGDADDAAENAAYHRRQLKK